MLLSHSLNLLKHSDAAAMQSIHATNAAEGLRLRSVYLKHLASFEHAQDRKGQPDVAGVNG